MSFERRAEVEWQGDLKSGSGHVSTQSHALEGEAVSWPSRTGDDHNTNPEELLAAAHASCFSMALSGALAKAGVVPRSLHVTCTVTFAEEDGTWGVTHSHLEVVGGVPGVDEVAFQRIAERAKDTCPMSRVMHGNVELTVQASLDAEALAAAAGP